MAQHSKRRQRRARDKVLVIVTAAGMSGALVLGHATNTTVMDAMVALSNTVIGAGGRGDPLGERVQQKLGATVQPAGYDYEAVHYPATIDLAGSRDIGVPLMHLALAAHSSEDHLIVAGYSEGSLVAERVRRDLQANPAGAPSANQLTFVMMASPFAPNGGIYSRFPGLFIPFIIDPMAPSEPTQYDTIYHAIEYDTFSDFPAYFNPLALLNAALAFRYAHPDAYYDAIDPETTPNVQKEVENSAGGTDTYIMYRNPHLPLLAPIRELSSALRLTPLTEPLLGAIEPLLRLVVDMGYTDRTYANVDVHTPFSLFTPPHKVIEALLGVPDAIREGMTNLLSGGQTALAAQRLAADTPSISVAASPSASPSDIPALHNSDLTASRLTDDTETEPVVAQEETVDKTQEETPEATSDDLPEETPEVAQDAEPTDTEDTSTETSTEPSAESETESEADTKPETKPKPKPNTKVSEPEAKPDTEPKPETKPAKPDTKDTKVSKPDTKPDKKASAPDSTKDRTDAAA